MPNTCIVDTIFRDEELKCLTDAYREHRDIFEATARHDPAMAARLARAHIASAKAIVLRVMASPQRAAKAR